MIVFSGFVPVALWYSEEGNVMFEFTESDKGILQPAFHICSLDAGKSLTGKWIRATCRKTTKNWKKGTEKGLAERGSMTEFERLRSLKRRMKVKVRKILRRD